MEDFEMMCETLARKIFQCGRFDDPLGRLANADQWYGLSDNDFSMEHLCKAWAIVSRLQNEYLDSVVDREALYEQSKQISHRILNANSNQEIIEAMKEINAIVLILNLLETPHISYRNTNDK